MVDIEKLAEGIYVDVSKNHRFGSDAFLLADFAHPRCKDTVCDLGTGCGIIPMIMSKRFAPTMVMGVDIQEEAYELFCSSILASQVGTTRTKLVPLLADLRELTADRSYNAVFDVVTCNPPFKVSGGGILSQSSSDKIARHETECTINDVCGAAKNLLRFGGRLCICQRPERLMDVMQAMRDNGIEPKRLRFVSKGKNEAPWLFLLEGKKGAKPFLQVLRGMYMYNDSGAEFSTELKQIYGEAGV